MSEDRVIVFDTTCRDGKQAAGRNHGPDDTVAIAHQLRHLGVDVMEAGFAISSEDDFACVSQVASKVPIRTCSLARASAEDIEYAARALQNALLPPRIHVVIATSELHLKYKLKISRDEVLERVYQSVTLARRYVDDVQFSAEDASRSDRAYLAEVVRIAIAAGARTINLPDTVGFWMPEEAADLITYIRCAVPEVDELDVVLSVHCHNDLGCAVANTLSGVAAGARQIEGTINGIGERTGNADLASVIMALNVRHDYYGVSTGIDPSELCHTAELVSRMTHCPIPDTQPVVGKRAFAHASGIHGDGALKLAETYEIIPPASVGWKHERFPLVSQSGRASLRARLRQIGYQVGDNTMPEVYDAFLKVASTVLVVEDDDLRRIMQSCNIAHERDADPLSLLT